MKRASSGAGAAGEHRSRWRMLSGTIGIMNTPLLFLFILVLISHLTAQTDSTSDSGEGAAAGEILDTTRIWIDVEDVDIKDAVRMIAKSNNLNIIFDKEIGGRVTLHLSDVPVYEGLENLAGQTGLTVRKDGVVYRITRPEEKKFLTIEKYRGRIKIDAMNVDIYEFLSKFSTAASISIIPDKNMTGKVSGKLFDVPPVEGLKAILEANNFRVISRNRIYHVVPFQAHDEGNDTEGSYISYANGLVSLDVDDGNISAIIEEVARQSDIELLTYENPTGTINATLHDIPLSDFFQLILGGTNFTYIEKDNIVMLGNRNTSTPSGQALSKSEIIHLKHTKADLIPGILPRNIEQRIIKVVKEQNAVLVSGTSEDILKTRDFISIIDIPTPQVVIDAIVVEYSRDLDREFGLSFGLSEKGSNTLADNTYSWPYLEYKRKGANARELLLTLGFNDNFVTTLPDNFFVNLRLLESEGDAKVLARPTITVLNGNRAVIKVSQKQYFRISGGTKENPTYNFHPIEFGIELHITPWISSSGQITAEIKPEISNAIGFNTEGYPNLSTRTVSTTVRIDNGETLVLGGLLRSENQKQQEKVPILGSIPLLGYLFSTTRFRNIETNLVIYITPRVIEKNYHVNLEGELQRMDRQNRYRWVRSLGARNSTVTKTMIRDTMSTVKERKESNSKPEISHEKPKKGASRR